MRSLVVIALAAAVGLLTSQFYAYAAKPEEATKARIAAWPC